MIIIKTLPLLRQSIHSVHQADKRIALVPTMGNLHDGHMRLIHEASVRADIVVVSIFVNPMQFDCINDLKKYPRTFQEDCEKLKKSRTDFVFAPSLKDIYPKGIEKITYVNVPIISTILEGISRPGHFRGVSTILSKLFNLVQPDIACFGEKDYQQLMLIQKMVIDMNYNIDIIGVPIVRAKDGLALSSRNSYLTSNQRRIAPELSRIMNKMAENISVDNSKIEEIVFIAKKNLKGKGFRTDIIDIRDADTLCTLTNSSKRAVILVAAWLGQVRLIDNKIVRLKPI